MKNLKHIPLLALSLFLLTACSGVMDSAQPARQYYMLMPYSGATGSPGAGPPLVIAVSAVPGLDSDHIQAIAPDARLNRYANARWPDHLPEVLTSVIKRSLDSSGRFASVSEGSRASGEAWMLNLEVQQFYGLQNSSGSTSSVKVEITGVIECGDKNTSFTLSDSNTVTEERLAAVVAAHQQGLDDVTRQLLQKISGACS